MAITSKSHIRNLGVMSDARLNFEQQVEYVQRNQLSRLMLKVRGPEHKRRLLLTSNQHTCLSLSTKTFNQHKYICKIILVSFQNGLNYEELALITRNPSTLFLRSGRDSILQSNFIITLSHLMIM